MHEPEPERIQTVVIGGGQTGLATGYHLARLGLPYVILDENARTGDRWRGQWTSLRLYSPARSDGLPGTRFPGPGFHYPTGREMGDFLESYATEHALNVVHGSTVDGVRAVAGGFRVDAGARRFMADQVVVATGGFGTPHVPGFADQLDPAIRQLHSSEYQGPEQLRDGPVLVVGASHSGADLALEAARSHPTVLSGRIAGELPFRVIDTWRARILWPAILFAANHILTLRTPMGRAMAPHVRSGGGPLLRVRRPELKAAGVDWTDARTTGAEDGKPVLADGRALDVANVLWCTGFRPAYDWISPSITGPDGWPEQHRGVVSAVPGLYVLGVPFLYSFSSMLVAGAGRDARYIAERIAERVRGTATVRHAAQIATG